MDIKRVGVIIVLLCLASPLQADEVPLLNPSTRIETLGRVYASLPDNIDLLMFNPAGLEYVEDSKLALLGLRIDLNGDTVSTVRDFLDAYSQADTTYDLSLEQVNALREYAPHFQMAGPFQISYVRRHWGISLLNTHAQLAPTFRYWGDHSLVQLKGRQDTVLTFAYGRRVYRQLSAGLTLRYQVRTVWHDQDIAETTDEDVLFLQRGLGFDLGFLYALQRWPLTVGLAYHDVFNTHLSEEQISLESGDRKMGGDRRISQRLRLGITYQSDFKIPYRKFAYMPVRTLASLEFGSGDSFGERLHLGTEVMLFRWLALRMGINAGFRIGLGLNTQTVSLDYMYATSLDDHPGVHSISILWRY